MSQVITSLYPGYPIKETGEISLAKNDANYIAYKQTILSNFNNGVAVGNDLVHLSKTPDNLQILASKDQYAQLSIMRTHGGILNVFDTETFGDFTEGNEKTNLGLASAITQVGIVRSEYAPGVSTPVNYSEINFALGITKEQYDAGIKAIDAIFSKQTNQLESVEEAFLKQTTMIGASSNPEDVYGIHTLNGKNYIVAQNIGTPNIFDKQRAIDGLNNALAVGEAQRTGRFGSVKVEGTTETLQVIKNLLTENNPVNVAYNNVAFDNRVMDIVYQREGVEPVKWVENGTNNFIDVYPMNRKILENNPVATLMDIANQQGQSDYVPPTKIYTQEAMLGAHGMQNDEKAHVATADAEGLSKVITMDDFYNGKSFSDIALENIARIENEIDIAEPNVVYQATRSEAINKNGFEFGVDEFGEIRGKTSPYQLTREQFYIVEEIKKVTNREIVEEIQKTPGALEISGVNYDRIKQKDGTIKQEAPPETEIAANAPKRIKASNEKTYPGLSGNEEIGYQVKLVNASASALNQNNNEAVYLYAPTIAELNERLGGFFEKKYLATSEEEYESLSKEYAGKVVTVSNLEESAIEYNIDRARRRYDTFTDISAVGQINNQDVGGFADLKKMLDYYYKVEASGIDMSSANAKQLLYESNIFLNDYNGKQSTYDIQTFYSMFPRLHDEAKTLNTIVTAIDDPKLGLTNYEKTLVLKETFDNFNIQDLSKENVFAISDGQNFQAKLKRANSLEVKITKDGETASSVINVTNSETAKSSLMRMVAGSTNKHIHGAATKRIFTLQDIAENLASNGLLTKKELKTVRQATSRAGNSNLGGMVELVASMLTEKNKQMLQEIDIENFEPSQIEELIKQYPQYEAVLRAKQYDIQTTYMAGHSAGVASGIRSVDEIVDNKKVMEYARGVATGTKATTPLAVGLNWDSFKDNSNSAILNLLQKVGYNQKAITPNKDITNPAAFSLYEKLYNKNYGYHANGLESGFFYSGIKGDSVYLLSTKKDNYDNLMKNVMEQTMGMKTVDEVKDYMKNLETRALIEPILSVDSSWGGPSGHELQIMQHGNMLRANSQSLNVWTADDGTLNVRIQNTLEDLISGSSRKANADNKVFNLIEEGNFVDANYALARQRRKTLKDAKGLSGTQTFTSNGVTTKVNFVNLSDVQSSSYLDYSAIDKIFDYVLEYEPDSPLAKFLQLTAPRGKKPNLESIGSKEIKQKSLLVLPIGEAIGDGTKKDRGILYQYKTKGDNNPNLIKDISDLPEEFKQGTILDYLASDAFLNGDYAARTKDGRKVEKSAMTREVLTKLHQESAAFSQLLKESETHNDELAMTNKVELNNMSMFSVHTRPIELQYQSFNWLNVADANQRSIDMFGQELKDFGIMRGQMVSNAKEYQMLEGIRKNLNVDGQYVGDQAESTMTIRVRQATVDQIQHDYRTRFTFENLDGLAKSIVGVNKETALNIIKTNHNFYNGTNAEFLYNTLTGQDGVSRLLETANKIIGRTSPYESKGTYSPVLEETLFYQGDVQKASLLQYHIPKKEFKNVEWNETILKNRQAGEGTYLKTGDVIGAFGDEKIIWDGANGTLTDYNSLEKGNIIIAPDQKVFDATKLGLQGGSEKLTAAGVLANGDDAGFFQSVYTTIFGRQVSLVAELPSGAPAHAAGGIYFGDVINNLAWRFSEAGKLDYLLAGARHYLPEWDFHIQDGRLRYNEVKAKGNIGQGFIDLQNAIDSGEFAKLFANDLSPRKFREFQAFVQEVKEGVQYDNDNNIYTLEVRRLLNQEKLADHANYDDLALQNLRAKYRGEMVTESDDPTKVNAMVDSKGRTRYLSDIVIENVTSTKKGPIHDFHMKNVQNLYYAQQNMLNPENVITPKGVRHKGVLEINLSELQKISAGSSIREFKQGLFGTAKPSGSANQLTITASDLVSRIAKATGYDGKHSDIQAVAINLGFEAEIELPGKQGNKKMSHLILPIQNTLIRNDELPYSGQTQKQIQGALEQLLNFTTLNSNTTVANVQGAISHIFKNVYTSIGEDLGGDKNSYIKHNLIKLATSHSSETAAAGSIAPIFENMVGVNFRNMSTEERKAFIQKTAQEVVDSLNDSSKPMINFAQDQVGNFIDEIDGRRRISNYAYASEGYFLAKDVDFLKEGKIIYDDKKNDKLFYSDQFEKSATEYRNNIKSKVDELKGLRKELKQLNTKGNQDVTQDIIDQQKASLQGRINVLQQDINTQYETLGRAYYQKVGIFSEEWRYPLFHNDSMSMQRVKLNPDMKGNTIIVNPLSMGRLNLDFDGDRLFGRLIWDENRNTAILRKKSDLFQGVYKYWNLESERASGDVYNAIVNYGTEKTGRWGFKGMGLSLGQTLEAYRMQLMERLYKGTGIKLGEDPDTKMPILLKDGKEISLDDANSEYRKYLKENENMLLNKEAIVVGIKAKSNKDAIGLYSNTNKKIRNVIDDLSMNYLNDEEFLKIQDVLSEEASDFLPRVEQKIISVKHTKNGGIEVLYPEDYMQGMNEIFSGQTQSGMEKVIQSMDEKFLRNELADTGRSIEQFSEDKSLAKYIMEFSNLDDLEKDLQTKKIEGELQNTIMGLRAVQELSEMKGAGSSYRSLVGANINNYDKAYNLQKELFDYYNTNSEHLYGLKQTVSGIIQSSEVGDNLTYTQNGQEYYIDNKKMVYYTSGFRNEKGAAYTLTTDYENGKMIAHFSEVSTRTGRRTKGKRDFELTGTPEEVSKKMAGIFFNERTKEYMVGSISQLSEIREKINQEQMINNISEAVAENEFDRRRRIATLASHEYSKDQGVEASEATVKAMKEYYEQSDLPKDVGYFIGDYVIGRGDIKKEYQRMSKEEIANAAAAFDQFYSLVNEKDLMQFVQDLNYINLHTDINTHNVLRNINEQIIREGKEVGSSFFDNEIIRMATESEIVDLKGTPQEKLAFIRSQVTSGIDLSESLDNDLKLIKEKYAYADEQYAKEALEKGFNEALDNLPEGSEITEGEIAIKRNMLVTTNINGIMEYNRKREKIINDVVDKFASPEVRNKRFLWDDYFVNPGEAKVGFGNYIDKHIKDLSIEDINTIMETQVNGSMGKNLIDSINRTKNYISQYQSTEPEYATESALEGVKISDKDIETMQEKLNNMVKEKSEQRTQHGESNAERQRREDTTRASNIKDRTIQDDGSDAMKGMFKGKNLAGVKNVAFALAALGVVNTFNSLVRSRSPLSPREREQENDSYIAPDSGPRSVYMDKHSGLSFNVSAHSNRYLSDSSYRQAAGFMGGYDMNITHYDNRDRIDNRWLAEKVSEII